MGKKTNKQVNRPNAPDFQQILMENTTRQPPNNPYYPDLEPSLALLPPPAYSDLSVNASNRMSSVTQPKPYADQSRFPNQSRSPPAAVFIHQPQYLNLSAERQHKNVRKYNNQMTLLAFIVIISSIYAHSLYSKRPCVNYLVHSPAKDISITVFNIRDMHLHVAYGSMVLLLLCLAKCSTGQSRSYSCYLFMIGLTTLIGTLFTGYLAYLAFYSPCSLKLKELLANGVKTFVGGILDSLPAPDKGAFGESNVMELGREDQEGLWIFLIDVFNFALYLSGFISAVTLC